jgi:hypothetical protein
VPLRGVGAQPLEPADHALELGVVEQVGPAAAGAHEVVLVLAAGQHELVAHDALPHGQAADEAQIVEQPERAVHGRRADPARRLAERVGDVLGGDPAAFSIEQRDDGVAGAAAAVARLAEHPARLLGPAHAARAVSAVRASPMTR